MNGTFEGHNVEHKKNHYTILDLWFCFIWFFPQSKNIVLEKTVEYINQVNTQLKELCDLQRREEKLGKGVPPCVLYM